jgi:hypothetical protein
MTALAATIKKVEEGFLIPFYTFLDTGVNTIKASSYTELHGCVVRECDLNDRAY